MTGDQVKLKSVNIQTHFISCFVFCFAVLAAVPWKVNHDESHLSSSFVFTYLGLPSGSLPGDGGGHEQTWFERSCH